MGLTIDYRGGRFKHLITCDSCGQPIHGRVHIDPPAGARDYERYSHADDCPEYDDDDRRRTREDFKR